VNPSLGGELAGGTRWGRPRHVTHARRIRTGAHFVVSSDPEPVGRVALQPSHHVLDLRAIVLIDVAVSTRRLVHLKRELVVARPLGPEKPHSGHGDVRNFWGDGLARGTALGREHDYLAGTRSAQLVHGDQPELVRSGALKFRNIVCFSPACVDGNKVASHGGGPGPLIHLEDVVENVGPVVHGRVPPQVDGGLAALEHLGGVGLVRLTRLGEEGHSVARPAPQFVRFEHGVDSDMVFCVGAEVRKAALQARAAEDGPVLAILAFVAQQHFILQVGIRDGLHHFQLGLVFPDRR